MRSVLVWDLPVRLFHLLLGSAFLAAFVVAHVAEEDSAAFTLHMALGLVVGLVVLLRLAWGLVGSRYARFGSFDLRPAALGRYVRGLVSRPPAPSLGHNAASSWAVVVMLILAIGLVATGMLLPVLGHELGEVHEVLSGLLLAVAAVHVLGVGWHAIRHRDGIALSIVDGHKQGDAAGAIASRHPVAGLALLVLALGWAALLFAGYDGSTGRLTVPGTTWAFGGEHEDGEHERHGHD